MEVKISNDPVPVISINGRMDTGNTVIFEEAIAPLLKSPTKDMIIDGSDLEYISSSACVSFLYCKKTLRKKTVL